MVVHKAYKYRIYPNQAQEVLFQKTFGCVRFAYNHFLEDRIKAYQEKGESRTFFQQNKALTELKKEYEWLQEPDKNALQNALRNVNAAFQNFFRNVKKGRASGFPKYKSKKNGHKSYATAANGNCIRVEGKHVRLPKAGNVKARISRQIPEGHRIVSATISQEPSGKYYVSILTEYEEETQENPLDRDTALGLDYSSPHFYVSSDGEVADMPRFYRNDEKKLAREQRKLSKMTKGSSNWKKQKIVVARAYEKVRFQRKDWQHKKSKELADKHDIICVEDINLKGMAQGMHFAKATNDNGFGQFREFLSYKMAERGKKLITIDKWFPSTKICHCCGYVNDELTLKDRIWTCPCCGEHHNRDVNAAINIREVGLLDAS